MIQYTHKPYASLQVFVSELPDHVKIGNRVYKPSKTSSNSLIEVIVLEKNLNRNLSMFEALAKQKSYIYYECE